MADYREEIKRQVSRGDDIGIVTERLFLSYPPLSFGQELDVYHTIRKKISARLRISISNVHLCGSCFLGISPFKLTPFEPGRSDLDIAIVDASLFERMLRASAEATNNYKNNTGFKRSNGRSDADSFVTYAGKLGMIRPDMMPRCEAKQSWFDGFSELTTEYTRMFSKISAGIYLSEYFFTAKQNDGMKQLKDNLNA